MKRKDLNQLLNSIKDGLFPDNIDKRSNLLNLMEGSRFEEINETTGTIVISAASEFTKNILNLPEFKNEIIRVARRVLNSDYDAAIVLREE